MNIELDTRIPLEPGRRYYAIKAEDEYVYAPCDWCDGTGKVEVKGKNIKIRCPQCGGKNSMRSREVLTRIKYYVAKYCLRELRFDNAGKIISAYFVRVDTKESYGVTLYNGSEVDNLSKMEIWGEPLSEDYGAVLKEVKRKNKLEREGKKDE
ncbi:hypothetical protein [Enterocloster bolteae]|uniref:hypothetical protein n=1 Tax=Enterocloster bolteae TaxID=208479 RepID=UPI002A810EE4|nr:hypothetical protein [Enterocloster bolteae]